MSDPIDERKALSLGIMACQFVAEQEARDVVDWQRAAVTLRAMLAERQPKVTTWELYTGPSMRAGRRRKNGHAHS